MFDDTQFSQDEKASVSTERTGSETEAFAQAKDTDQPVTTEPNFVFYENPNALEDVPNPAAKEAAPSPSFHASQASNISDGASPMADSMTPPPAYAPYQFGQQPVFTNQTPPPHPPKPVKKNKKKSNTAPFWKRALLVACLGLIFGLCAGGTLYGISKFTDFFESTTTNAKDFLSNSTNTPETTPVSKSYSHIETDISQVAKNVMPSVVSITTVSVTEYQSFFGYSFPQESQGSGSGVIVGKNDTELLIVTNNHVVAGAQSLTVTFLNDEIASAQIKGTDANMDLAVIAVPLKDIKDDTMDAIAIATIGDSDALQVGEPAIAIGNALGYGQSVTSGIISALNREVTVDNVTNSLIQTDAAINPGNSGGALLNLKGELIGINSVKYSSTEVEGMGYALPISSAMPIIEKLMVRETKSKVEESGYMGVRGADVTEDASRIYNLPIGICVSEVVDGSGADKAGIKVGDIITEIEGTTVTSMKSLQAELAYYAPGETISVKLQVQTNNGYSEKEVKVTLSKQPKK